MALRLKCESYKLQSFQKKTDYLLVLVVDVDRGFLDKTGESTKENTHITKDRYTEYIRTHSSLINRQKI